MAVWVARWVCVCVCECIKARTGRQVEREGRQTGRGRQKEGRQTRFKVAPLIKPPGGAIVLIN